jgi:Ca-activated chloride channel family protein
MSSPNRLFRAVIIAAVAGFILYSYLPSGLPPGPAQGTGQPPAASEQSAPTESYALRPENTWPLLGGEAEGTPVTDNLFAANYYVVLDASGSMKGVECSAGQTKIEAARAALASFAQSLPPDANLGLAVFENQGLSELLPLGLDNRDQFARVVQQVVAGAGTPLRSAIELAYNRLLKQGQRQLGYGEYHLVVVTDGQASQGEDPTRKVNAMLAESPVVLHTIGFCIGENHALNQPGRTYYRAADNPAALQQGLDEVVAEAPTFDLTEFKD